MKLSLLLVRVWRLMVVEVSKSAILNLDCYVRWHVWLCEKGKLLFDMTRKRRHLVQSIDNYFTRLQHTVRSFSVTAIQLPKLGNTKQEIFHFECVIMCSIPIRLFILSSSAQLNVTPGRLMGSTTKFQEKGIGTGRSQ